MTSHTNFFLKLTFTNHTFISLHTEKQAASLNIIYTYTYIHTFDVMDMHTPRELMQSVDFVSSLASKTSESARFVKYVGPERTPGNLLNYPAVNKNGGR